MKYQKYEDKLAPLPAFLMGWKIPPRGSHEFYSLYLAGKLLYDGESSRLYQKLVKGTETVLQLFGFTDERRGPSAIYIGAIPKDGKDLPEIRQTITEEIKSISENGVNANEMQKLRNQLINDEVRSRQSSLSRAKQLAEFALYDGNPNLINTQLEVLLKIDAEDIKKAAAVFLNSDNHAFLDVVPQSKDN
jgi:predicted Zn-dependent peptidase